MAQERERNLPERREERGISPSEQEWFAESPMRLLQRMREDFDRMLTEWPAFGAGRMIAPIFGRAAMMPSVDVWETDSDVMIRADLPGVEPDNVEIFTTEDAVRIRGEMRKEEEQKERGFYRVERCYGIFDRTVPLPTEIQADQAKATFRNGVLEITLPKTQQAKEKMRKVPIESEQQMAGAKGGQAGQEQQQKQQQKQQKQQKK
jgi:HSP20 family protein